MGEGGGGGGGGAAVELRGEIGVLFTQGLEGGAEAGGFSRVCVREVPKGRDRDRVGLRFIACVLQPLLLFLEGLQTVPELVERARDVPVL